MVFEVVMLLFEWYKQQAAVCCFPTTLFCGRMRYELANLFELYSFTVRESMQCQIQKMGSHFCLLIRINRYWKKHRIRRQIVFSYDSSIEDILEQRSKRPPFIRCQLHGWKKKQNNRPWCSIGCVDTSTEIANLTCSSNVILSFRQR